MDASSKSSRSFVRISSTGHAYSCPDITSLGFTGDECKILAKRHRATNYLFHLYSDQGQPIIKGERTKSYYSCKSADEHSRRIKSDQQEEKNKMSALFCRNEEASWIKKRSACSTLPKRKKKSQLSAYPRAASFTELETTTSTRDPFGTIIIRSMNQYLSPSATLERYLINLQREGYLTCAKNEDRKNIHMELDRAITPKGEFFLKSKFLPYPPVYLFERDVQDSPFNNLKP